MKRNKIANYIISFALIFGLGFFIKEVPNKRVINFLDSSFFVALVTVIVGSIAIYLYKKQQRDNKRNAARLIIQEIRYAEQQIRNAKRLAPSVETNYYMALKLLPTNSWHKNIHLFVEDLKEENLIDLISQFYSQAAYLDSVIKIISDEKNKTWNVTKSSVLASEMGQMQIINGSILPSGFNTLDFIQDKEANGNVAINLKLQANQILSDVTNKIEFIYNSPAVDKLRNIAEGNF